MTYPLKIKKRDILYPAFLLRDTDDNSKPLRAEIPVFMRKRAHGEVIWMINRRAAYGKLDLSKEGEYRLTKFFEIPEDLVPLRIHARIDRHSLAIRYRELIDQGYVKNKADLARHLGVTRAWITKVMKELKRAELYCLFMIAISTLIIYILSDPPIT
jgi:hypothetical protein